VAAACIAVVVEGSVDAVEGSVVAGIA